jgi:uncharacterized protein (TIGR03435 family)
MRLSLILFLSPLFAQSPPAFDAASIKPTPAGQRGGGTSSGFNSITFQNTTLRYCIAFAYKVKDYQIIAPKWLEDEHFDINAKGPEGSTHAHLPEMLQTLLKDRFHLEFHRETKDLPGLELVMAKDGIKVPKSAPKPPGPGAHGMRTSFRFGIGGSMSGENVKMESLASSIAALLGRPVVNQTKLDGEYDISLDFSFDDTKFGEMVRTTGPPPPEMEQGESVFKSIQKLGLKLEAKKVPTAIIVVDRMDRTPTEN